MGLKDTYDILNKLGEGAFSTVYLALHRPTCQNVAIKIVKKNYLNHKDAIREAEIHKKLNHPNIVKLYEFFEDDQNFYFSQELCENGNVSQFIIENGSSEGPEIKKIFVQLINAVCYLHEVAQVLHCDIKAENILLDSNNNVKLSDFGFSFDLNSSDQISIEFLNKIKGSPAYISPEILKGESVNSTQSDVWSIGVFLYFLVTGNLPFDDNEFEGLVHSIIKMKPSFPSYLSSEIVHLLKKILKKNPKKRFTMNQIKNNKWIKETSESIDEIYKNVVCVDENVDLSIVQLLLKNNSNDNYDSIVDDIVNDDVNDNSVSYKILLKKKENENVNNHLKLLIRKNCHQRSSDLSATQLFHYRPRTRSQNTKQGKRIKKVLINSKGSIPKFNASIKNLK